MLTDDQIQQLAAELHASERSRQPVEHFSKRFAGMTDRRTATASAAPGWRCNWPKGAR
ncbi:hypothetical protein MASR1M50_21520 [Burkholderiales bacterium]